MASLRRLRSVGCGSNWSRCMRSREASRCFATQEAAHHGSGARIGLATSSELTLALRLTVGAGALGLGLGAVAALAWWQLPRIQAVLHPQEEALSFWERLLGPQHPADRIFDGADLDRDGRLDRRELAQYMMSCGIMDMSGFNAIWEEINTESSEAISREEFRSFHDNAERNFYLSLWRSLLADPSFLGSALYLSGSVLFAAMPYWSRVSPATITKLGQVFYIFGGILFLSQTLETGSSQASSDVAHCPLVSEHVKCCDHVLCRTSSNLFHRCY
ncbi:unnamed protein product [Cladocopium goreaui]|uniref:EF-hand domain-containing protein n=1 Tax=Cladocopium goreaui TaxID=2562237 RepID=A0A9P1GLC9_9DINO|nr:unnamed protein product [Cladocopium goreaui]